MITNNQYIELMQTEVNLALATCVNNQPNVRVMTFAFDANKPNILYVSTDRANAKVQEFAKNSTIAFTTIPKEPDGNMHARSTKATIRKSTHSAVELKHLFLQKSKDFEQIIQFMGDALDVFEIEIKEVVLTISHEEAPIILTF